MISAIVLTKNDEKYIAKTLTGLTWCDEIIVIDDGSIDKTQEIVKKYTKNIFFRSLDNDFAAQRNFGLSKAKHEWVLFVDSDEMVSNKLKEEIESKLSDDQIIQSSNNQQKTVGYYIKRTDYFIGNELKHGETSTVKLLRLGRRNIGKWIRPVHEVWDIKGLTSTLKNPLTHYPHPTLSAFIADINRYTTINANHLYQKKVPIPFWHVIAYPLGKFLRNYIVLLGFFDGTAGAVHAILMSFHSFLTRAKLYIRSNSVSENHT